MNEELEQKQKQEIIFKIIKSSEAREDDPVPACVIVHILRLVDSLSDWHETEASRREKEAVEKVLDEIEETNENAPGSLEWRAVKTKITEIRQRIGRE